MLAGAVIITLGVALLTLVQPGNNPAAAFLGAIDNPRYTVTMYWMGMFGLALMVIGIMFAAIVNIARNPFDPQPSTTVNSEFRKAGMVIALGVLLNLPQLLLALATAFS